MYLQKILGTLSNNTGESYISAFYPHLNEVDPNCK